MRNDEIKRADTFIKLLTPVKTFCPIKSPYKLKHLAEDYLRLFLKRKNDFYISERSFIEAMIKNQFKIEKGHFNISEKQINLLEEIIYVYPNLKSDEKLFFENKHGEILKRMQYDNRRT